MAYEQSDAVIIRRDANGIWGMLSFAIITLLFTRVSSLTLPLFPPLPPIVIVLALYYCGLPLPTMFVHMPSDVSPGPQCKDGVPLSPPLMLSLLILLLLLLLMFNGFGFFLRATQRFAKSSARKRQKMKEIATKNWKTSVALNEPRAPKYMTHVSVPLIINDCPFPTAFDMTSAI